MIIKVYMDKKGLFQLFNNYQVKALKYLLEHRSCYSIDMVNNFSEDASRASFIQFLNRLSHDPLNIVTVKVETSKGGYRNKYSIKDVFSDEESILYYITELIHAKLSEREEVM